MTIKNRGPKPEWRGKLAGKIEECMIKSSRNWSLNSLAEEVGCARDVIRQLPNTKGKGTVSIWQGIARALGVTEGEVRGVSGPQGIGKPGWTVLDPTSMEGRPLQIPEMSLVLVEDNAMSPKYCQGEYCLVSATDKIKPGDVVAFPHGGRWYVRQYTRAGGLAVFTGTAAGTQVLSFKKLPKMLRVKGCYIGG